MSESDPAFVDATRAENKHERSVARMQEEICSTYYLNVTDEWPYEEIIYY